MKIQYCSDLHLEFPENRKYIKAHPLKHAGEILLLAGDILPFTEHKKETSFIDFIADHYEMVYWIPGNHEYYGYDIGTVADPLLEKIRSNVWLVNNQVIKYKNAELICSTLWSHIGLINALDIQRSISDFFAIKWKGKKFTTQHFNDLHAKSLSFLKAGLDGNSETTKVVVTHHVPTLLNYPNRFRNSPLNEAFVTEFFDLIVDSNISHWIYGHHHSNTPAFNIGSTLMLTNQLGYVRQREYYSFAGDAFFNV